LITPFFSTPYGEEHIEIDNQKIIDYAYSMRKKHEWSEQGYQTPHLDLNTEAIQEILTKVKTHLLNLQTTVYAFSGDVAKFEVSSCWINITDPNHTEQFAHTHSHNHPGNFTSLVYYPQAQDDCGNLTLENPNTTADWALGAYEGLIQEYNIFNSQRLNIIPITGMLVSFPSYVKHFANTNLSKKPRISMAFNAQVRPVI
tara:strand:+ start:509 stop:1108 length:600 start_codon:yes stop_codon:yes gene_type:complete